MDMTQHGDEHGHDEHGHDEHGHDEHTDMATCMSDGTCLFNTAEIEELKNTGQGVGSLGHKGQNNDRC